MHARKPQAGAYGLTSEELHMAGAMGDRHVVAQTKEHLCILTCCVDLSTLTMLRRSSMDKFGRQHVKCEERTCLSENHTECNPAAKSKNPATEKAQRQIQTLHSSPTSSYYSVHLDIINSINIAFY